MRALLSLLLLFVTNHLSANVLRSQIPLVSKKVTWEIGLGDLQQNKELVFSAFKLAKLMQDKETINWLFLVGGAWLANDAIVRKNHSSMKEMLELGLDVDTVNSKGDTILHLVLKYYNGTNKMVRLLLESGADVNAVNNKGETPLHIATEYRYQTDRHEYRNKSKIKILLENGAKVNAVNNKGETPMHIATKFKTSKYRSGYREMLELLENGAEINAVNNEGETPFDIATKYRGTAKQKLLLQHNHLEQTL